jgi:hypothetical protein
MNRRRLLLRSKTKVEPVVEEKKTEPTNDLLSEPKVPTTHRVVEKKPTPVIETKSNKKKSKKKKNKNKNKRNNDNDVHTEDA